MFYATVDQIHATFLTLAAPLISSSSFCNLLNFINTLQTNLFLLLSNSISVWCLGLDVKWMNAYELEIFSIFFPPFFLRILHSWFLLWLLKPEFDTFITRFSVRMKKTPNILFQCACLLTEESIRIMSISYFFSYGHNHATI